ncbi:MAG TPA: DUF2332 domain-containing protein [Acidimicrobiales bacterium]|nr:DUF2332 domain-containing protein [Acidimicrobiales bacterium]HVB71045.1 DUF2332 domain-containing protein [Acidimicrobiales bacterium]
MELDLDDARKRYGWALTPEDQERLPFYAGVIRALSDDDVALHLLAEVRTEQRNPMLILAALHYLALEGHPVLGPLYDAVRHGRTDSVDEMVTTVIFVLNTDPDLVRAQLHRSTQTNEPGRSAVLRAVLPYVAAGTERVNLLDVGTSAGLNLYLDMYRVSSVDDADPMTLVCRDEGPVDRSIPLPEIATRTGIDRDPLDLTSPHDQRWLEACVWPEERRRFERMDAIIHARESWPDLTILRGDALERLDDALAAGEAGVPTVMTNTWFAAYLSRDAQATYFDRITQLCANGDVAWISLELPAAVEWPAPRGSTAPPQSGATQVMVTRSGDEPEHFGWCHHHGRWLIRDAASAETGIPAPPVH